MNSNKNDLNNLNAKLMILFILLAKFMENKNKFYFAEKLLCEILNFDKTNLLPNNQILSIIKNNLALNLYKLNRLK